MSCIDLKNQPVAPGLHFAPGPDSCTLCICDNGSPKWCKAVLCSPPQNCKSFRVGHTCCEFICLENAFGKAESDHDYQTDLFLRLIAAAITAILSLTFLFFILHRIRKRKIIGRQDRALTEEERSLGSIGYIAGSLGYVPDHHFEEHGAGYSLWKPISYSRGEAPPPYEEALAAARAEAALARPPGPSIATHLQAQHRTIPVNLATSGALLVNASMMSSAPNYINSCPDSPLEGAFRLKCSEEVSTGVTVEPIVAGENILSLNLEPPSADPNPALSDNMKKEVTDSSVIVAADESDDYRSECENCNMRQTPGYGEDLVTMTLHRRTGDSGDQHFYSNRASLTLPTHPRKQQRCSNGLQSGVTISCARENWFSSMPESSSSDEEEEEEEEE